MKFIKLRLRTKFVLAIVSIVITFGGINIFLIYHSVGRAIEDELRQRLDFMGDELAEDCVTPLLYRDHIRLQKLVDNVTRIDQDIGYCFILDPEEKVVVHSFNRGFPEGLGHVNSLKAGELSHTILVDSGEEVYRDIASPILSGSLGTVRIGLRQHDVMTHVRDIMRVFIGMVMLFLAIGIAGAFVAAGLITKPIDAIIDAAERFDPKSRPVRLEPRSRDEIGYLTVTFNRMTARLNRLYEELRRSQQKLIQADKMAALGVMAAGIAHEINNPLAGVKGGIRRILQAPEDEKQVDRYRPLINTSLDHIEKVVENLLWFAREREDVVEPIDLGEVIEKAFLLVAHRLKDNGIRVRHNRPPNLPLVPGNPQHLQQVMMNLLLNAADAMPDGGDLTIETGCRDSDCLIRVTDTGRGIDPKDLGRVFDPFFTTKRAGEGTGLGLSVSYRIVKTHGGDMSVKSSPGEGTTFTVTLPASSDGTDNRKAEKEER